MSKTFKRFQWITTILLTVFVLWGMWNNYERTKLNRLYGQQIEQWGELNKRYHNAVERVNANNVKTEEVNERMINDLDELRHRILQHLENAE